jgi:alpha-D-ribose 1-methylphosphonate 5-triphosphate synthase subunit PhnG
MPDSGSFLADRPRWMRVLAKSSAAELEAALGLLAARPSWRFLRRPETGLALVRGRIGGSGDPFNMGEMTMTRCVVALEDGGAPGHAYVAGRDRRHAELAAVFDALLQREPAGAAHDQVKRLGALQEERRRRKLAQVQPTKVEFFTMVRE